MKIAFVWQGLNGRYGVWDDGLRAAMRLIEKEHKVKYFDFPLDGIHEFEPDVVLYWEAPCTLKGEHAANYKSVIDLPYKKALLFAGGPVEFNTCYGFDLYFVESKINEDEFEALGLPWKRAFGVNTDIMKPFDIEKKWDAMLQATSASWKRQWLIAEAFGGGALLCGRNQVTDSYPFTRSKELGATVLDEQAPEKVAELINSAHCVCNTSEFWGGGQRATLEAFACGVPVICMTDSPKNREYVEESGAGIVCKPIVSDIREAFNKLEVGMGSKGVEYVQKLYTERHYAASILDGINDII